MATFRRGRKRTRRWGLPSRERAALAFLRHVPLQTFRYTVVVEPASTRLLRDGQVFMEWQDEGNYLVLWMRLLGGQKAGIDRVFAYVARGLGTTYMRGPDRPTGWPWWAYRFNGIRLLGTSFQPVYRMSVYEALAAVEEE